jgi:uncharacterized protein (TIGR03435 family)
MTRRLIVLVALGLLTVDATAQQAAAPQFEVASIKPRSEPLGALPGPQGARPGGSFVFLNASLVRLVMYAFDLPDYQVVDGPAWARANRFDVEARAGRDASVADMRLMLRSLLQDRFKLATHNERREMPVYALVVDRRDGQLGPGLTIGCPQQDVRPPAQAPPGAMTTTGCGSVATLVRGASLIMQGPVIDKTGLVGTFAWSMYSAPPVGGNFGPRAGGSGDLSLPSYTTALREQLGLRLDATRGPVEVVVIDSAERPSEN